MWAYFFAHENMDFNIYLLTTIKPIPCMQAAWISVVNVKVNCSQNANTER